MNRKHFSRVYSVLATSAGVCIGIYFVVQGLSEGMHLYVTPSEMENLPADNVVRLGGMVVKDSFYHQDEALDTRFQVTDGKQSIWVNYHGVLPALFKEERSVVAVGKVCNGELLASEVLAKHDEYYQPRDTCHDD